MKKSLEDYILQEVNQYIQKYCDGCRFKHPSQKHHMLGCFSKEFCNESRFSVAHSLLNLKIITNLQYESFIKKYYRVG
jgi:hypothetical protein